MFLHIKELLIKEDYNIIITFTNNEVLQIDFKNELEGEIFKPLLDKNFFKKAYINKDTLTIEWPNGADFAPEYLYEIGIKQKNKVA